MPSVDRHAAWTRWHHKYRKRHRAYGWTYQISGEGQVHIPDASIAVYQAAQDPKTGIVIRSDSRDFICSVKDLVINGSVRIPIAGHQILFEPVSESGEKTSLVYDVCSPGDGAPVWEYHGSYADEYRIHTKLIKAPAHLNAKIF